MKMQPIEGSKVRMQESLHDQRMSVPNPEVQAHQGFEAFNLFSKKCSLHRRGQCPKNKPHLGE